MPLFTTSKSAVSSSDTQAGARTRSSTTPASGRRSSRNTATSESNPDATISFQDLVSNSHTSRSFFPSNPSSHHTTMPYCSRFRPDMFRVETPPQRSHRSPQRNLGEQARNQVEDEPPAYESSPTNPAEPALHSSVRRRATTLQPPKRPDWEDLQTPPPYSSSPNPVRPPTDEKSTYKSLDQITQEVNTIKSSVRQSSIRRALSLAKPNASIDADIAVKAALGANPKRSLTVAERKEKEKQWETKYGSFEHERGERRLGRREKAWEDRFGSGRV